jgi:hypothetical protein
VISHTRRSPLRYWRQQYELLVPRQSSFAKFSGITILRKRHIGSEKMIFQKTTHTYLLAHPNLGDEIHLKGGRFVTSQNYKIMFYTYYSSSSYHSISIPKLKKEIKFSFPNLFFSPLANGIKTFQNQIYFDKN